MRRSRTTRHETLGNADSFSFSVTLSDEFTSETGTRLPRRPFCAIHEQSGRERAAEKLSVQQKIAGTFRSTDGATAFCTIHNYLSTIHKQDRFMSDALAAVFADSPFPVAWGSLSRSYEKEWLMHKI
jgi:hypothetical protein